MSGDMLSSMCWWGRGIGFEINKPLVPCPAISRHKLRLTANVGTVQITKTVEVCNKHNRRLIEESETL